MTDPDTPMVSVIMATYNCAGTLHEALDSLVAQTYRNWELVVCDDASSDTTLTILEEFAARYPAQVVLLRNSENYKLAYSLNRCLEAASGELIARMDADDRSTPTRLEELVAFLGAHPEVDVIGSAMQRFNGAGLADVVTLDPAPDRWSLRHGVPFAHATVMMRASAYSALGGYTVARRTERGQDYDLWFRFFHLGFTGRNLPTPLYQVREDLDAIRRRTLKVRFRTFQTALIGHRLLGYPLRWYVYPVIDLAKAFVPSRAVQVFRLRQARRSAVSSSR